MSAPLWFRIYSNWDIAFGSWTSTCSATTFWTRSRTIPTCNRSKAICATARAVERAVGGCDAVIHLACISNDPSFELDPALGKSINYDCFPGLVASDQRAGVRRFIYASSSSVYGIKEEPDVTEDLPLQPLTDYSKFKAMCEDVLLEHAQAAHGGAGPAPGDGVRLFAATCAWICRSTSSPTTLSNGGRSPSSAASKDAPTSTSTTSAISTPNRSTWPGEKIDGKIYNAGWDNLTIDQIAQTVQQIVGPDVTIEHTPSNDKRSYHISSEKIRRELGFAPRHTVADAVRNLTAAFTAGKIPEPDHMRYYNIKTMQHLKLR